MLPPSGSPGSHSPVGVDRSNNRMIPSSPDHHRHHLSTEKIDPHSLSILSTSNPSMRAFDHELDIVDQPSIATGCPTSLDLQSQFDRLRNVPSFECSTEHFISPEAHSDIHHDLHITDNVFASDPNSTLALEISHGQVEGIRRRHISPGNPAQLHIDRNSFSESEGEELVECGVSHTHPSNPFVYSNSSSVLHVRNSLPASNAQPNYIRRDESVYVGPHITLKNEPNSNFVHRGQPTNGTSGRLSSEYLPRVHEVVAANSQMRYPSYDSGAIDPPLQHEGQRQSVSGYLPQGMVNYQPRSHYMHSHHSMSANQVLGITDNFNSPRTEEVHRGQISPLNGISASGKVLYPPPPLNNPMIGSSGIGGIPASVPGPPPPRCFPHQQNVIDKYLDFPADVEQDLKYVGIYDDITDKKVDVGVGRLIRVWSDDRNRLYYDCICKKRKPIKNLKAIASHAKRHNTDSTSMEVYTCDKCGRVFAHYLGLNSHQRVHRMQEQHPVLR